MTTKICDHCKKEKDILEFNWKYKALGIRLGSVSLQSLAHENPPWRIFHFIVIKIKVNVGLSQHSLQNNSFPLCIPLPSLLIILFLLYFCG